MDGQQLGELCHSASGLTVDFLLEVPRSIRHAEAPRGALGTDFAEHSEPFVAVLDEASHLPGAKRTAAPEHEHPFEQAGLTGAIRPKDVVSPWVQVKLHLA